MKRFRFVWIDDNPARVGAYRDVVEAGVTGRRATVEFFRVSDGFLEALESWVNENRGAPPNLVIIDHVYNTNHPFEINGSSVAHLLRRALPAVPMVCVTAKFDQPRSFDQEDISEYSALFMYQHFENHIEDLYAIARDFPKLSTQKGKSFRQHLVECLRAPTKDVEDLKRVLPEEFRDKKHGTTQHRAARWILNVFMTRPGFLYDRTYAATLLGLTSAGFQKVEEQFKKALYKGLFATTENPRWWVSELRNILFRVAGEDASDIPQYAGRSLPGVSEGDYSVCYASKHTDPPPDAVVAADVTHGARLLVVQRQYSDNHPGDPGTTPGFETRLILRK